MSMRTTARYFGWLNAGILAAAGLLGACGGADGDGMPQPGGEELGTSQEALDADGDTPACAAVRMPDGSDVVLAVNTNNELMMSVLYPGATSATWTRVDTGVSGVPSLAVFDDGTLDGFARSRNRFYEYWRHAGDSNFTILPVVYELTDTGAAAYGSPVVVEVGDTSDYGISVAVQGNSNVITTWDWPVTYSYTTICPGCVPTSTTVTGWVPHEMPNKTTSTITGIPVRNQSFSRPNPIFGVRDDHDTGWFGTRNAKAWGQPYGYLRLSDSTAVSISGATGTPAPADSHTAYANVGATIRHSNNVYAPTWDLMNNCYAGGSIDWSGYFRDANGRLGLVQLFANNCTDEGEILTSKPTMSINSATRFVYFKGGNGNLYAHKSGTTKHFNMGLTVGH